METEAIIQPINEQFTFEPGNLFRNRIYQTGLAAIVLSLLFFLLPFSSFTKVQKDFGLFLINYVIAALYFLTLWFSGRLKKKNGGIYFVFPFLILFLISAYALNREMNVFEDSTNWLCVLLIVSCINYLAFACFDRLSLRLQKLSGFILGLSFSIFLYLSVYLLPMYGFSALLSIFLGFSMHTFVPLFFVIFTVKLVRRTGKKNKAVLHYFGAAIGLCFFITTIFAFRYSSTNNSLANSYREAAIKAPQIPAWVYASQNIKQNSLTEKVLKAGILYSIPNHLNGESFFRFSPPMMSGEKTQHDPLVMTAALFSSNTSVTPEERVNMLKIMADKRHATQDRLWRGDDLETKHIKTVAQVWPSLHLAYTEKTLTVANNNQNSWNRQEAIYTFSLPEGSVVTALSLWINGKEEKSVLTTKEKADTAYKTIVGVEQRDPSVLHWQEGNTVSVRIFPVLGNEERTFKIGVTSPMPVTDGQLVYNNIVFQGPATLHTTEDVEVRIEEAVESPVNSTSLSKNESRKYMNSGKYNPAWSLAWEAKAVQPASFNFNGNSYLLRPYNAQRVAAIFNSFYLDINETWSLEEVEDVYKTADGRPVFVYENGFKRMTADNMETLFESLKTLHYSLFPFHLLPDISNSIVITKSGEISATLHDLKGSPFYNGFKNFAGGEKIKLFNLGSNLSVYLRTLREMRLFNYEQGSTASLDELIRKKHFATDIETDNLVVLHDAGLTILKDCAILPSNAPDHLMRLFAYNHIMQRGCSKFLDNNIPEDDTLVEEAKAAYIVTPLSSLIVLESKKDYDRFDIHPENKNNSLLNASTGSKGSVPEPHEWALIILALITVVYMKMGKRMKLVFAEK